MRRFALILHLLIAILIPDFLYGNERVDSVLNRFNSAPSSATARHFFEELVALDFMEQPINISNKASLDSARSVVWYWAAEYYYEIQEYTLAEVYAVKALPLIKALGDKTMEADCASLLGIIYIRLSDFNKAAVYAKQCNLLDLQSGNPSNIASSYNTLASIYMTMRQPEEAEKYILNAIEYIHQVNNPCREAVIYGMASEVYQHKGEPEKTLYYATQAWEIEKRLGRREKIAIRQSQRASALNSLKRFEEAKICLDEAIPILDSCKNIHSLGIAYNQMGDMFLLTRDKTTSAAYYYKALDIFVAQHDIYNESHSRKGLREALREIAPKAALMHGDRFEQLRDSIYDREANLNLSRYAAQYNNQLLQKINKQQRTYFIALTISFLVIFSFIILFLYMTQRRQKHKLVDHFNQLLTEVDRLREQARMHALKENADQASAQKKERNSKTYADDKIFLARVVELVHQGMDKGYVNIEDISDTMFMSISTFRRRMIAITRNSPKAFIITIQMDEAVRLLVKYPEMPISAVALRCGFNESGSFARTFRRMYGMTPAQYRAQKGEKKDKKENNTRKHQKQLHY